MDLNVNVNANTAQSQQPHEQTPQFFLGENVHVWTKSNAHLSNSIFTKKQNFHDAVNVRHIWLWTSNKEPHNYQRNSFSPTLGGSRSSRLV